MTSFIRANGIDLAYEVTGPANGVPVLLIMGFTAQMTSWPDEFHLALADKGCRVIRFDNRDNGLSQKFTGIIPDAAKVMKAISDGTKPDVPYTLNDMADDAAGLLDALDIPSAHVAGASMGGMIAQLVAVRHRSKTRSLSSLMSTTSDPSLPRADPRAQEALMSKPPAEDRQSVVEHSLKSRLVTGSPGFPEDQDRVRAIIGRNYDRSFYPEGALRQWSAIMASGSRTEQLKSLDCPTLVIHGAQDILIRPEAGRHTAACIKGAELKIIEGWGHNMPVAAVPVITTALVDFFTRVEQQKHH